MSAKEDNGATSKRDSRTFFLRGVRQIYRPANTCFDNRLVLVLVEELISPSFARKSIPHIFPTISSLGSGSNLISLEIRRYSSAILRLNMKYSSKISARNNVSK